MKLTLRTGKGVQAKDGTPYAAGTIHLTRENWHIPVPYCPSSIVSGLFDEKVTEIHLIDGENNEAVITIVR